MRDHKVFWRDQEFWQIFLLVMFVITVATLFVGLVCDKNDKEIAPVATMQPEAAVTNSSPTPRPAPGGAMVVMQDPNDGLVRARLTAVLKNENETK